MTEGAQRRGLGGTLAHAQNDGFFTWFHLTEVDESGSAPVNLDTPAGALWRRFRPSGERFQALTEVDVAVNARGGVEAACLGIDRTFISAPSIRPFARDIAKSYLHWILPADAAVAMAPVVEDVGRFCDGESTVIVRASPARPSWFRWWRKRPGDEADVFMGKLARAGREVGRTRIVFENLSGPLPQGVAPRAVTERSSPANAKDDAWLRIMVSTT